MSLEIQDGIPFRKEDSMALIKAIMSLKDGQSVYIDYSEYNKTKINNALCSARIRVMGKNIKLKTLQEGNGRRIWAFKNDTL